MKRLQMAGNRPVVLVGGGTGLHRRPPDAAICEAPVTPETIQHNCDCFKKQMERFIDFGEAGHHGQQRRLALSSITSSCCAVGACFSVNNMLRAECYKQRMERAWASARFKLHDHAVPPTSITSFQHYGCNMQFGGDDQWSNMLGGTELIRRKLGKDAHAT